MVLNVNSSSWFGRFSCRKSHTLVLTVFQVFPQGSLLSSALALIPFLKKASFSGVAGSFVTVGLKLLMPSVSLLAKAASVLCQIP